MLKSHRRPHTPHIRSGASPGWVHGSLRDHVSHTNTRSRQRQRTGAGVSGRADSSHIGEVDVTLVGVVGSGGPSARSSRSGAHGLGNPVGTAENTSNALPF